MPGRHDPKRLGPGGDEAALPCVWGERMVGLEDEEREFWAERDATDFVDSHATEDAILPKLRPTTRTISPRLPESLLASIKVAAHKRDVPYQSLIKGMLADAIDREHSRLQPSP